MVRKSLIASSLSFVLYFVPAFFIWYYQENYKLGPSFFVESAFQFFFYSLPVIPVVFVVLLFFNLWFAKGVSKRSQAQNNKLYIIYIGGFAIIITLGFTLFDYLQFNSFGTDGYFLHILANYSGLFFFLLIILLLNRKICFNNFK